MFSRRRKLALVLRTHGSPAHTQRRAAHLLMVRFALCVHRRGDFGFTLAAMPSVRKASTPYHSLSFPSRLVGRSATSRPLLVPRIVLAQHEHALPAGDNPTAAAHAPQGGLGLEGAGARHGSGSSSDGGGRRRQTRYAGGRSANSGRLARQPEMETRGRRCTAKSGEGTRSEAGEEGSHNKEGTGGDEEENSTNVIARMDVVPEWCAVKGARRDSHPMDIEET